MEELSVTEFDCHLESLELPELNLIPPDTSVYEVVTLFNNNRDLIIGIGQEGKLEGIVTEWDLVHHFSPKIDPQDVKISDLMIKEPVTLSIESTLYDAMNIMGRRNFPSFAVLDKSGKATHIFNTRVLFKFLTSYFKEFLGKLGTKEKWDPTRSIQNFTSDFSFALANLDDSSLHESYFLTPFERVPSTVLTKADESINLEQAWDLLIKNKCESLILTRHGTKAVGVLTLRDLVTKVLINKDGMNPQQPIREIMTREPHTLLYSHPIGYGINQFMKYHYQHMVIVDEDRIPLNVVSLLEIFSHFVDKIKLN